MKQSPYKSPFNLILTHLTHFNLIMTHFEPVRPVKLNTFLGTHHYNFFICALLSHWKCWFTRSFVIDTYLTFWGLFGIVFAFALYDLSKLMQLGSPNWIDDFESNLKSESERRIVVDSDSNDLIESTRSNTIYNRSIFDYINKKSIKISI